MSSPSRPLRAGIARSLLLLTLCSAPALAAPPAPAKDAGDLPVWLVPSLGGTPAGAAAKLRERFSTPIAFKKVDDESAQQAATDCEQLLRLSSAEDYSAVDQTGPAMNFLNAQVSVCERLQLAAVARPSRQSFLKGYSLGTSAVNELPASMVERPSNDYARLIRESDETGTSLASFSRALGTKLENSMQGEQLVIGQREPGARPSSSSPGARVTLRIDGRGDFNGDGIEDLLLAGAWSGGGTLSLSYTRLVTRLAPGQVLKPVVPGSPATLAAGCSGDGIDRTRADLVKKGRDFTPASLAPVDAQLAKCEAGSPSLQHLWLLNDGAFVAYKLKQLDKCRDYLARGEKVKARVSEWLLPEGLKKALAHNQQLCAGQ